MLVLDLLLKLLDKQDDSLVSHDKKKKSTLLKSRSRDDR